MINDEIEDEAEKPKVEVEKSEVGADTSKDVAERSEKLTSPDKSEENPKEIDREFLTKLDLVEVVSPASYGGDVVQEITLVTFTDR